jgi:hypothetical protein
MANDNHNSDIISKDKSMSNKYPRKLPKKTSQPATRIIWYKAAAFGAIMAISWANELGGLAQSLFGGTYALNWQDAAIETAITILVAVPTILFSWRLSKRLHYLEGFLRVCAWCKKVGQGDDWISLEEFVQKKLNTQTTHGICPACYQKFTGNKSKVI